MCASGRDGRTRENVADGIVNTKTFHEEKEVRVAAAMGEAEDVGEAVRSGKSG